MPGKQPEIAESDFPSLYLAADQASNSTQKYYVITVAFDLSLMVIASALAVYNYQFASSKLLLYIISGLCLLISTFLTIILLIRKFEDSWYQGRALAESCKTLTWRFMTRSELFEDGVPLSEAKSKFVQRIQALKAEFPDLNRILNTDIVNGPVITQKMLDVRSLSLAERKQCYINQRIEDQKSWYAKKAAYNSSQYSLWFFIIIVSQFLSLVTIVCLISNPKTNWNFVGFFTTVSAVSLSWLQLKRHQELKQAYTTTANELNIILALSDDISNETEFSKFVLDSENAVSREHTLWLAQRRK